MILRVKDWDRRFESAKSRTYKVKTQTYMPNKLGLGYARLIKGPDGPAIYGAWCAVVGMLSRMEAPRHGYLTDTGRADGRALTPEDIEHLTQFPASLVAKMMSACSAQDVGWLENTRATDTAVSASRIPHGPSPLPSPLPLPLPTPSTVAAVAACDGFERFWKAYPRKVGKTAALKAWKTAKEKPSVDEILKAVSVQSQSEQWRKEGGQFIPHPATWLRQGRWADELPTPAKKTGGAVYD